MSTVYVRVISRHGHILTITYYVGLPAISTYEDVLTLTYSVGIAGVGYPSIGFLHGVVVEIALFAIVVRGSGAR